MKKMAWYNQMFGFIKNCFFTGLAFLSTLMSVNSLSAAPRSRILINNQECKVRPHKLSILMEMNLIFPFSIKTSKCSGSWNNIKNPYVKLCVPDIVKNLKSSIYCQELMKQDT